jgi:membrane associated rhomboid family serine protease
VTETHTCYRHPNRETLVSCSECGRYICEECMNFAPVGIRCPDHATVGPGAKPSAKRQVQTARRRATSLAAPATVALVVINVAVYLITVAQGNGVSSPGGTLYEKGALFIQSPFFPGQGLAYGDWWRLGTVMFLHASLLHIAFNMFALYWLGSVVEEAIGSLRFLLIYVVSGLAGSVGALLLDPNQVTVGASGAIWGVMGALLVLEYLTTGSFAGQAAGLILINLVITFTIPNISVGGHIGGLVGGIAATYVLMRTRHVQNRYVRPTWLGPALVVAMGVAIVVIAYVRVETYL